MIRLVLSLAFSLFLFSAAIDARINILEPWLPGQDSQITGGDDSYMMETSFLAGEHFTEFPLRFTYTVSPRFEAGGRWGIRHSDGYTGINDLELGCKYQLLGSGFPQPFVIIEGAVSLPTADSTHALGTGATAWKVHWAIEKQIDHLNSYLGLGFSAYSENQDHLRLGNVFSYRIGARYPYKKAYHFYGELKGFNHARSRINGTESNDDFQELYLSPGIDYHWKGTRTLTGALMIGLTPESHDLGVIISSHY